MKKLKLLLCCSLCTILLAGCGTGIKSNETDKQAYRTIANRDFLVIKSARAINGYSYIYVDVETKVQYISFDSGTWHSTTILIDADGKPILYEGEL